MDVVSEGRNATSSGTGKRESGAGSEPGGSDKDSDNDEKVCTACVLGFMACCKVESSIICSFFIVCNVIVLPMYLITEIMSTVSYFSQF